MEKNLRQWIFSQIPLLKFWKNHFSTKKERSRRFFGPLWPPPPGWISNGPYYGIPSCIRYTLYKVGPWSVISDLWSADHYLPDLAGLSGLAGRALVSGLSGGSGRTRRSSRALAAAVRRLARLSGLAGGSGRSRASGLSVLGRLALLASVAGESKFTKNSNLIVPTRMD